MVSPSGILVRTNTRFTYIPDSVWNRSDAVCNSRWVHFVELCHVHHCGSLQNGAGSAILRTILFVRSLSSVSLSLLWRSDVEVQLPMMKVITRQRNRQGPSRSANGKVTQKNGTQAQKYHDGERGLFIRSAATNALASEKRALALAAGNLGRHEDKAQRRCILKGRGHYCERVGKASECAEAQIGNAGKLSRYHGIIATLLSGRRIAATKATKRKPQELFNIGVVVRLTWKKSPRPRQNDGESWNLKWCRDMETGKQRRKSVREDQDTTALQHSKQKGRAERHVWLWLST